MTTDHVEQTDRHWRAAESPSDQTAPRISSAGFWLVVVGASAGGVEAVRDLVGGLGADFPAAVLIVLHTSPSGPSFLAEILERATTLPVSAALDGETLKPGHIYVAVPDRHLLVNDGTIVVSRGPRENRYRPSVDALFRSAAYTHGHAVIGVVLSGMLDDGTSGLWTIKRLGGVGVAQTPSDALFEAMPRSALDNVEVDYVLPARTIGPLLTRLVQAPPPAHQAPVSESAVTDPAMTGLAITGLAMTDLERRRLAVEVRAAAEGNAFKLGLMELGELTPLTCPECHGVLLRVEEGPLTRFRCHTGHAYTASSLAESVTDAVESNLYKAQRSLEEAVMLFRQMEGQQRRAGDQAAAQVLHDKAQRAELFAQQVQVMSSHSLNTRAGDEATSEAQAASQAASPR